VARLPDYNLEKLAKRAGVIRLVKDLQARGLRIDAIDNQAHWQLQSPTIAEIDQAFTELMRVIPPPKSSAAVGAKTGRATRSRSTTSGESLRIGDVMVGAVTAERFNPSSPIVEPRRREHVGWTPLLMAGGLYIANAHETSPASAQILREALAARGLNASRSVAPAKIALSAGGAVVATCSAEPPR
jgi:hypothetical protein